MKNKFFILGSYLVSISILIFVLLQPHYEAKTFNKFRDEDQEQATYWDAAFANLRVH